MNILIALVLLAVAADQGGLPSCENAPGFSGAQAAGNEAVQCVLTNARRLEPSGERADLVAAAALSRCDGQIIKYGKTLSAACGYNLARRTEEVLRRKLTSMAIAEIVERRSR